MLSEIQLAANRANALKSTGPRTEQGKQRSSLNALRHGFTAQVSIMTETDREALATFTAAIIEEFDPKGPMESQLAQFIATCQFRLNRMAALEDNLLALGSMENLAGNFLLDHPQVHEAACQAQSYRNDPACFDRLSLYGQRLFNRSQRAMKYLRQMQAERKTREEQDLQAAVDLYRLFKMQEQPFDPQENGFVFSLTEIRARAHRQYLDRAAGVAKNVDYNPKTFAVWQGRAAA